MRRTLLILFLASLSALPLRSQPDSLAIARTLELMDRYVEALETEPFEVKSQECDFMIETCTDSLLRQAVALKLYSTYFDSPLMGDEAVSIHLYDRWFADGIVKMKSDADLTAATLFAEFNRSSQLYAPAPELEVECLDGSTVSLPVKDGKRTILYFYDVSCSKCSLESIVLKHYLNSAGVDADLVAFYCGSDREAWETYARERLDVSVLRVFHVWDPEVRSDFQRKYGILQTPRLFLVDRDGSIIGRRLDVDALKQLLEMGAVADELAGRNPVGSRLPDIRLPGTFRKGTRAKEKTLSLRCLKGKPAYLVFYSETCGRCAEQLSLLCDELGRNRSARAFLVDTDRILAENPDLAGSLFDSFDLSVLPHIIALDRKGMVTERYVTFPLF